jgi:hypothetical protein
MADKTPVNPDEARLKKKVSEKRAAAKNPEGDASLRSLHKRLKRVQRKRRKQVIRLRHAMGNKAAKTEKTEAPAAS